MMVILCLEYCKRIIQFPEELQKENICVVTNLVFRGEPSGVGGEGWVALGVCLGEGVDAGAGLVEVVHEIHGGGGDAQLHVARGIEVDDCFENK